MNRVLIPECYPDNLLLRILGFNKNDIEHSGVQGKGEVINKLVIRKNKSQFGIGLIDEDIDSNITLNY
jgi:hypothetical protein